MAVEKRLAFSIVQFLRDQTHGGALNSDEQESLEGGSAARSLHMGGRTVATGGFFNHRMGIRGGMKKIKILHFLPPQPPPPPNS